MNNLAKEIYEYLKERNWEKLKPADIAKSIMIEGAELLELFQWSDDELEVVKKDEEKINKIKEELADVFIYSIEMATLLDIDIDEIVQAKLEKARKKYPKELFDNKDIGSDVYWDIKKKHRENK